MPADAERFARLQDVFAAVAELSPAARETVLDEQCSGDPALRADVESLLAMMDAEGSPLETAGGLRRVRAYAQQPEHWLGQQLGAFQLDAVLGQGGMGTVFAAHRVDGPFEQHVAVKVITQHIFDQEAHRRFEQERAMLARLEHPNIARLIDGGTTDDGIPYLVMERVAGEPIDQWCERQALDVPARLRLMVQLCAAVQHAHSRLVLHRDIKPSNILVSADGGLKLLDFGIARTLDLAVGDPTVTRDGLAPITPQYAAPEQFSGGELSVSTDVYQLGILLYRLLSGRLPFSNAGTQLGALLHAVMEEVPPSPSRSTVDESSTAVQRTVRHQLSGDLDDIVMMAIRKEPAARYATVTELSADLERWLAGQPVRAHGQAMPYRARKFLRRHRVAVALGALAMASIGAGVVSTIREGARTREAAALAVRQEARASAISQFLQNMLVSADPFRMGGEVSVRTALDRAAAVVDTSFRADPETREAVLSTIGITYLALGLTEESRPYLDSAIAINERLGQRFARHAFLSRSARISIDLGEGRFDALRAQADSLLPGYAASLGATDSVVIGLAGVRALSQFGSGDVAGAVAAFDSLMPVARLALGDTAVAVHVMELLLANMLAVQGQRGDEASALVRRAVDAAAARPPGDPANLDTYTYAIEGLARLGQADEAQRLARAQVALAEEMWGAGTAATLMPRRLLALSMLESRRIDTALVIMRGVVADAEQTLSTDNPRRVTFEQEYATLLIGQGQAGEAEALLRRVHAFHLARDGESSPRTMNAYRNLASAVRVQGRSAESLEMLEGILGLHERTDQLGAAYFTTVLELVMAIQQERGAPLALARLAQYVTPARERLGRGDRTLNQLLSSYAQRLVSSGQLADGELVLREVRDNYVAARDGDSTHPDVQWASAQLQAFYQATGRVESTTAP